MAGQYKVRIVDVGEEAVTVRVGNRTITITATGEYHADGRPGVQLTPGLKAVLKDLYRSLRGREGTVTVPEETVWLLLLLP